MRVCIAEKPSVAGEIAKILGASSRRDGYYEVKFGDNIIGKRPGNGNNIEIE